MTTYNQLNQIEQAIVDDLTKGWYVNGEFSNPTDISSMFMFAADSVKGVDDYSATPNVNTTDVMAAIVSRYNYGVWQTEQVKA